MSSIFIIDLIIDKYTPTYVIDRRIINRHVINTYMCTCICYRLLLSINIHVCIDIDRRVIDNIYVYMYLIDVYLIDVYMIVGIDRYIQVLSIVVIDYTNMIIFK